MGKLPHRILWLLAGLACSGCAHRPTPVVTPPVATARPAAVKEPKAEPPAPAAPDDGAVAMKARDTQPAVSDDDLKAQVRGNTAFALDLAAKAPKGNLVFSPYSLSAALAMAYVGARGHTAEQMRSALHFALPPEKLHPAFDRLDLALASRAKAKSWDGKPLDAFQLHIANALWADQRLTLRPAFRDTVGANYGAGLRLLDFTRRDAVSATINDWVAKHTDDRIKGIVGPDSITRDTRLVLTNAVYFFAEWMYAFDKDGTKPAPFTRLDGRKVSVPLMDLTGEFHYAHGDGWQVVELPYEGREVAFDVLLPANSRFAGFERGLDAEKLGHILGDLNYTLIHLRLPRFKFETSLRLKEALRSLGMSDAFGDAADLGAMGQFEGDPLYLQDVLHRAVIDVDEKKTEALAVTAMPSAPGAPGKYVPPKPIEMRADHPFLFLIRDLPTGQILFWGRIVDPSAAPAR
jgi:serpin B